MALRVHEGDAKNVLKTLAPESVHCVVTSPPYYGLRDYEVPGQIGLESTPVEYITNLVTVFREVRRVLRKDGTFWLNIGDSYADKDLIGIPWMLAFALKADDWCLRSDIIWSKPNPMPESVTDRPTKAHEYVFLLTRSARYFYDADAIREQAVMTPQRRFTETGFGSKSVPGRSDHSGALRLRDVPDQEYSARNKRSVWEIATEPFPEAHFATYPTALVEPCIKAGTSEKGCCPECGAPWVRVVESSITPTQRVHNGVYDASSGFGKSGWLPGQKHVMTTGWRASCAHADLTPQPATVLDPFCGAGTTLLVADRLDRDAIGIELNPTYAEMARTRLVADAPMFVQVLSGLSTNV